jgi:hypothetical protein
MEMQADVCLFCFNFAIQWLSKTDSDVVGCVLRTILGMHETFVLQRLVLFTLGCKVGRIQKWPKRHTQICGEVCPTFMRLV